MDVARSLIKDQSRSTLEGTVIIAEQQSEGRGRYRDRHWHSPKGGVYLSVIVREGIGHGNGGLLSLLAGVAACESILPYLPCARIKWVNDVLYGGRKLCGNLVEAFGDMQVIGIGVDTNIDSFPDWLADKSTSIKIETGRCADNGVLITNLLRSLDWHYTYLKEGNHQRIVERYRSLTDIVGRDVVVSTHRGSLLAVATAIDSKGRLVVRGDDGETHTLIDGEISYR